MVSVVIPNHNYNHFLAKRLESVVYQSYRDMEIIFLDDASTDGSLETAQPILEASALPFQVVTNQKNSGSVFAQWQRGLEHASGEYIWFAEADDACDLSLLSRLVAVLDEHPRVGLAYAESAVLDENDLITDTNFFRRIHSFIDPGKWIAPYISRGTHEIRTALAIMNTIPNASGVVMRREVLERAGGVSQRYTVSGDWATYIRVLEHGDIAYIPQALNYNRFHSNRVTIRSHRNGIAFDEAIEILREVLERHEIPEESKRRFVYHYLDQKFLNGYTPAQGEEVITPLLDVIEPQTVFAAVTEHMESLATFKRQNEASLSYRIKNLTVEKVRKRLSRKKKI